MKESFHHQLDELKVRVLRMAGLTRIAVENAFQAWSERNPDIAGTVIAEDSIIDAQEVETDSFCLRLLALKQPVARDLRFVIGSMHVADELESIADQAVKISKSVLFFASRPPLPHDPALEKMFHAVQSMLTDIIEAYNHGDDALAEDVGARDEEVNELEKHVMRDAVERMSEQGTDVEMQMKRLATARSLERIGDLSTNIGESVILIARGENIKHHLKQEGS